jgi:archaellum component FlaC
MGGVSSGDGSGGADLLDALTIMVENLRKESYANFGSRLDTDMLKKKIDEIQHHMIEQDQQLHNHEIGLSQCRDITDANKLDIDELKNQIKNLKAEIKKGTHDSSSLNLNELTVNLSQST